LSPHSGSPRRGRASAHPPGPRAQSRLFAERFEAQYGATHPRPFRGSYRDALRESKRSLVPLVVYLHSPHHYNAPGFCRDVLGDAAVIAAIEDRGCLFWWGDVSDPEAHAVAGVLGASDFPFLGIVAPPLGQAGSAAGSVIQIYFCFVFFFFFFLNFGV
jgi:hypothetical protein